LNRLNVQLTTYIGLFPFYLPLIHFSISSDIILKEFFIEVSIIYGAMISSFISGMQWQYIIYNNKKYIIFPIIPFSLAWLHFLDFFVFFKEMIIIIALIVNLLIDLLILNKKRESWFKKMRIIATFLACSSFVINFLLL
jgi:hypothetical protein